MGSSRGTRRWTKHLFPPLDFFITAMAVVWGWGYDWRNPGKETNRLFFLWFNSHQWASASSLSRFYDHTQMPHIRWDFSGRVISPDAETSGRHHKSLKEDIHAPAGFEPAVQAGGRSPTSYTALLLTYWILVTLNLVQLTTWLKDYPPSNVELILYKTNRRSQGQDIAVPIKTDLSHIKPASHGVFRGSVGAQYSDKINMLYNNTIWLLRV